MSENEEVLFRCPAFVEAMAQLAELADPPDLKDVPASYLLFEPVPAPSGMPGEGGG